MRIGLRLGAVVLLISFASSAAAESMSVLPEAPTVADRDAGEMKRDAMSAYAERRESAIALAWNDDDYPAARRALASVRADPRYRSLSAGEQNDVESAAAWVALQTAKYRAAAKHYRRAVALDPGDPDDWHRLSMVEDELGHYDAAMDALKRVLTDWPQLTDNISGGHVVGLVARMPASSESRLALMEALYDADWKRDEEFAGRLWYRLALTYVERGERGKASGVIARIGWPLPLMRLQSDPRFDGLLPADPAYVSQALDALIDRLAARVAERPDALYLRNEWLQALLHAGRHEEVVAASDGILANIAAASPDEPYLVDSDDENFTLEAKADALRRLGRTDDAVAAMVRASQLTEFGGTNVTQKLGLGRLYASLMRGDGALAAVEDLGPTAGSHNQMERDLVQMRAFTASGNEREAKKALARIRKRESESLALLTGALLRSGRLDEAAACFIRRLQDPDEQSDALLVAQESLETAPLPGDVEYRRNRDAMLARDDVKAAIAKVGRVQRYEIW